MPEYDAPARVRYAPSPTGALHLGGARTALFNYLFARQKGGQFLLRIEDTDRARLKPDSQASIEEGLRWLGMTWDEPPVVQSERKETYQQAAAMLLESGAAYRCFCTPQRLEQMRELSYNDLSADRNTVAVVQALEAILERHAAGKPGCLVEVNTSQGGLVLRSPHTTEPAVLYRNRI